MTRLTLFPRHFGLNVFLFAGLALTFYFSYHTVFGERSYAHLRALEQEAAVKQDALATMRGERERLERDVVMMRPDTLSLDLLEERARAVLGYNKPEEYIIFRN